MSSYPSVPTPPRHPVDVVFRYPERSSRLYALLSILFYRKAILLVPHLVVLYFLQLGLAICALIRFFAVLFTPIPAQPVRLQRRSAALADAHQRLAVGPCR